MIPKRSPHILLTLAAFVLLAPSPLFSADGEKVTLEVRRQEGSAVKLEIKDSYSLRRELYKNERFQSEDKVDGESRRGIVQTFDKMEGNTLKSFSLRFEKARDKQDGMEKKLPLEGLSFSLSCDESGKASVENPDPNFSAEDIARVQAGFHADCSTFYLPAQAVSAGETWEPDKERAIRGMALEAGGSEIIRDGFICKASLVKIENGIAEIKLEGSFRRKSKLLEGVTFDAKFTTVIQFDVAGKRPLSSVTESEDNAESAKADKTLMKFRVNAKTETVFGY